MTWLPESWPPPTTEALTVFALAVIAVEAVAMGLGVQVGLPIATGLIGYLQGSRGKE
jgi:hypothetical protein